MSMNRLFMAATAMALMAGSPYAFAQQEHGGPRGAGNVHGGGGAINNSGGAGIIECRNK
jgi:hypothetical protein